VEGGYESSPVAIIYVVDEVYELCELLYFANEDIDIRKGKHPFFFILIYL
jgi:hypothetical protein